MELRQLQRFLAVIEHGSINKAAQLLAVSQPALSRSIAQLEQAAGASLFTRGPAGIALSDAGRELLAHARIILAERDRAMAALHRLRGQADEVVAIGTDAAFAMHRLPLALARLAQARPALRYAVVEGGIKELLEGLGEGRFGIVLGSRAPFLDLAELVFEPLTMEGASVAMRADHPLLAGGLPRLEQLVDARWIVPDHPSVVEGWRQFFVQTGLPVPGIALQTSSLQVTRASLLAGDFVAITDYTPFAAEIDSGALAWLHLGLPRYQRPAGIFRRRNTRPSAGERALLAQLRGD